MAQSLIIKDGNGATKSLAVESGSAGYSAIHYVVNNEYTPVYVTVSEPLPVTGTINVDVTMGDTINVTSSIQAPLVAQTISYPVNTVSATAITNFDWSENAGTFCLASNNPSRRGLVVFNPGPNNLYIALSSTGDIANGFLISDVATAPALYSFIVYPSGTYTADSTTVGVYHGGFFISGAASDGVFISAIS